ncbi:MAG: sulfite exporter TauE/SafE family protein [Alphaproteobacteria bacterium]|nr:sulfite exporter TauE/SafE family protein [Alphaproteobacteria bacterium]
MHRSVRAAMDHLLTASLAAAAGVALLAGVVRGFAGFGAAMILTPVFSALYGPTVGVPVCLLVEFCIALPMLRGAVGLVDWTRIGLLLLAASIAVPLGILVLRRADPAPLRWVLSGIVLGAVLLLASGWRFRGRPTRPATVAAGAASGFLNGLAGMAGPPIAFYYLAGADAAATVRASFIVYFGAVDLVALLGLGAQGLITLDTLILGAILALPYVVGGLVGERLFPLASDAFFRRLALVILTAVAVAAPWL